MTPLATSVLSPSSPQEMAEALKDAASRSSVIEVVGNGSKRLWAGPRPSKAQVISTAKLDRVLQAEPDDLTISVQSGMNFGRLQSMLAKQGQMIALDPPCLDSSTVGGILAAAVSGPLRRGYGTARDLVIGMTFATLEGKLVDTGGMVVKNVAGLDMAKLMIGSFGTLAVIVSANFRVHPLPQSTLTLITTRPELESVVKLRDLVLSSQLSPVAVEMLNPPAAARVGLRGFVLVLKAAGSSSVLGRYAREIPHDSELRGTAEQQFWDEIREFTPAFLARQLDGLVFRVTTRLSEVQDVLRAAPGPAISRSASGVSYIYLSSWAQGRSFWSSAVKRGWQVVVEAGSDAARKTEQLWLEPSSSASEPTFALMKRVKSLFDPQGILNPSRLYGRL